MWVNLIQVLLEQRLLGKHGIFNDELEQAGDVVRVKLVGFAQRNQALQQINARDRCRGPGGERPAWLYRPQ